MAKLVYRPWTEADNDAIRKYYPAEGSAMAHRIGRSPASTAKQASTIGVKFTRKRWAPACPHHYKITEELVLWAERKARRYARRYGGDGDRFGSVTSLAMVKAHRAYNPHVGVPYDAYIRRVVTSRLELEKLKTGLSGFRRTGGSKPRDGAPSLYSLDEAEGEDRETGIPPVGWDIDYADFVNALARKVPGIYADVIRLMYLDCRGADIATAARAMGMTRARVEQLHGEAIEKLRGHFAVLPEEARGLLRDAC